MRVLFLLLVFMLGCTPALAASDIPASTKDMVHLSVIATDVRLRAGAGTEFAIIGKASRNDFSANRYIADSLPVMDSTGKPWFKLLANVEQQAELGVFKLDSPCWIRSDFVETRALNAREAERVESSFFRILEFAPRLLPSIHPVAAIPAFSDENLCYFPQSPDKADISLPPGGELLPLNALKGQRVCVSLWQPLDDRRIRFVGAVPLGDFLKADFGADRQKVEAWLEKQNITP